VTADGPDNNENTMEDHRATKPSAFNILLDIFSMHRRFIFGSVLFCGIVATVIAFLITPRFKSATSVFPAERSEMLGLTEGVSSLMRSMTPKGIPGLSGSQDLDRYMAILKSGRVLGSVIRRFDLAKVYDITSYPGERVPKMLLENCEFVAEPEGNLTIAVYDEDPQRAADMANYFVEQLNLANTELLAMNARGNREFVEERYQKNLKDLAAAEDSLRAFQKVRGVIAMPEQTEASIKAGAEIAAQLAVKEVQLAVLRRTQSADHPSTMQLQIEIDEMTRKIAEMNRGGDGKSAGMKVLVPFASIPDLGTEYLRRFREVEIQYRILQFLTPMFEQAKVEERRQTPSVIVLDRAEPAERKAKPKRMLIMLGGLFVGFLGSLGYVVAFTRWNEQKALNTPLSRSVMGLYEAVRGDLRTLLRRKGR
jgi:tyrosine-protein kinase Etk/Wzc